MVVFEISLRFARPSYISARGTILGSNFKRLLLLSRKRSWRVAPEEIENLVVFEISLRFARPSYISARGTVLGSNFKRLLLLSHKRSWRIAPEEIENLVVFINLPPLWVLHLLKKRDSLSNRGPIDSSSLQSSE